MTSPLQELDNAFARHRKSLADLEEALRLARIAATEEPTPPEPPADLVEQLAALAWDEQELERARQGRDARWSWQEVSRETQDTVKASARAVLSALASGNVSEWLPSPDDLATEVYETWAARGESSGPWQDAQTAVNTVFAAVSAHLVPRLTALQDELATTRSRLDQVTGELNAAREAEVTSALTLKTMREQRDAALEEAGRLRADERIVETLAVRFEVPRRDIVDSVAALRADNERARVALAKLQNAVRLVWHESIEVRSSRAERLLQDVFDLVPKESP